MILRVKKAIVGMRIHKSSDAREDLQKIKKEKLFSEWKHLRQIKKSR